MEEKAKKVGLLERLGFTFYSTSMNIVYNFKSIYYLIFLTNVLEIPMELAGVMTTLGIVWDAVNDPLVGFLCANFKFRSGEKVRPYLLWVAVPWAVSMVFLFFDYDAGVRNNMIIGLIVFFVYEIFNTFSAVPYNSMGTVASDLDEDRKGINAFRSLGGCLGSGIGAVAVAPLVKMCGGLQGEGAILGKKDARALFTAACIMGVILVFGSLFHYLTTRERVRQLEENEEKIPFLQCYRMLFGVKSWILNMLYITCYGVVNTLIMTSISYYAAYVMGSSSASTPILAVYLVIAIAVSLVTPAVDRAIGRKRLVILALVLQIALKIPFIIDPFSIVNIYINAVSAAIGGTVAFIMFNTNRNNISDLIEIRSGRRIDSMVSTGDNLASKIAEAGVTSLMTLALARSGFDVSLGAAQPKATITTICALLGWVPALVSAVMLIVAVFLDPAKERERLLAEKER